MYKNYFSSVDFVGIIIIIIIIIIIMLCVDLPNLSSTHTECSHYNCTGQIKLLGLLSEHVVLLSWIPHPLHVICRQILTYSTNTFISQPNQ